MLLLVIVMKNMFKMNEDTYIITVFFRLGIKEAISLSLSLLSLLWINFLKLLLTWAQRHFCENFA